MCDSKADACDHCIPVTCLYIPFQVACCYDRDGEENDAERERKSDELAQDEEMSSAATLINH